LEVSFVTKIFSPLTPFYPAGIERVRSSTPALPAATLLIIRLINPENKEQYPIEPADHLLPI
jgi:hypothetical protein